MQGFESGRPGLIPGRGKCDLDFFSFPITLFIQLFLEIFSRMANNIYPDQTVPSGAD